MPGSESSKAEQLTQNDSPVLFIRVYNMIAIVCMDLHVSVKANSVMHTLLQNFGCICKVP